jgi:L-lysine 2,3-aminomutase
MSPTFNMQARRVQRDPVYTENTRFQVYTERQFDQIDALRHLPEELRFAMRVVANVLPFRVNQYVIDELIDWTRVPDDPVFQLTFPQQGMLAEEDFARMADALRRGSSVPRLRASPVRSRPASIPIPPASRK